MKKLNNKGLSIIELLVCFVIVAVIAITLLNTIMEYKGVQETEHIKNLIKTYKDQVTQVIERDIIVKTLSTAEIEEEKANEIKLKLTFKNKFDNGQNTKTLKVHLANNEDTNDTNDTNYIEYPDIVKSDTGYTEQYIRYELPSTTKISIVDNETNERKKENDIHFRNLPELSPDCINENIFVCNSVFHLYIPIEHSEIDGTYAIDIVAPVTP